MADSKLCTRPNMAHIVSQGGRFLTVLPATRKENRRFRDWMQTHEVPWKEIFRRPSARSRHGPEDVFGAFEDPAGTSEGYRLVWYHSTEKQKRDRQEREEKIDRAIRGLQDLKDRLASPKTRLRKRDKVDTAIEEILESSGASRWLEVTVARTQQAQYRQTKPGRPGPDTPYRRIVQVRFDIGCKANAQTVAYDEKTDGIFPLVTCDRKLSVKKILKVYKLGQPRVEQRHHHLKGVQEVAPQYLKSPSRIEAFLCVYFVALLSNALIEREIRRAMKRSKVQELPLYPEGRPCKRPTTEHVLRRFERVMVHRLCAKDGTHHIYFPRLTRLQRRLLKLLGIRAQAYRIGS